MWFGSQFRFSMINWHTFQCLMRCHIMKRGHKGRKLLTSWCLGRRNREWERDRKRGARVSSAHCRTETQWQKLPKLCPTFYRFHYILPWFSLGHIFRSEWWQLVFFYSEFKSLLHGFGMQNTIKTLSGKTVLFLYSHLRQKLIQVESIIHIVDGSHDFLI